MWPSDEDKNVRFTPNNELANEHVPPNNSTRESNEENSDTKLLDLPTSDTDFESLEKDRNCSTNASQTNCPCEYKSDESNVNKQGICIGTFATELSEIPTTSVKSFNIFTNPEFSDIFTANDSDDEINKKEILEDTKGSSQQNPILSMPEDTNPSNHNFNAGHSEDVYNNEQKCDSEVHHSCNVPQASKIHSSTNSVLQDANFSDIFSADVYESDSRAETEDQSTQEVTGERNSEGNDSGGAIVKSKQQRKRALRPKDEKDSLQELYSESQRLIRQSTVSLPYHMPQRMTLKEFLERRRKSKSSFLGLQSVNNDADSIPSVENNVTPPKDITMEENITLDNDAYNGKHVDSDELPDDLPDILNSLSTTKIPDNTTLTIPSKDLPNNNECVEPQQQISTDTPATKLLPNAQIIQKSKDKTPKTLTSLSQMKKLALSIARKHTPKLSGSPDSFIDLENDHHENSKTSKKDDLVERFIEHTMCTPKRPEPHQIYLQIIKKETSENSQEELKTEEIVVNVGDYKTPDIERIPGQKVSVLKETLLSAISKKERQSWENRLLTHKLDNEEDYEDGSENNEDYEEEGEELMTENSTDDEEEEEEEEDILFTKKPKPKCAFVDDEAEDDDDIGDEDDDDDSVSDQEDMDFEAPNIKASEKKVLPKNDNRDAQVGSQTFHTVTSEYQREVKDISDVEKPLNSNDKKELKNEILPTLLPKTPEGPQCSSLSKTPSTESIRESQIISSFKTPDINHLAMTNNARTPSSDDISARFTDPNKVSQTFASQNLYLSPIDDLTCDDSKPSTASKGTGKTTPTIPKSQNSYSKPGTLFRFFQSQPVSTQQNAEELLDLCSGKFTDDIQTKINLYDETEDTVSTQQKMDELLDLCSGRFTGVALQLEIGNETLQSTVSGSLIKGTEAISSDAEGSNLKAINTGLETEETAEAGITSQKKIGGRRILFISSDEDTDSEDLGNCSDNKSDLSELKSLDDEDKTKEFLEDDGSDVEDVENKKLTFPNEFFDDEAELSGSDVGSDEDADDDEEEAISELEAPDEDLPSDEELRNQIGRVHLKRLLDEDQKEVKLYQEMYLEDGDLHDEGGERQRKFRWSNSQDIDDDARNQSDEEGSDHDDENDHVKWRLLRHDRQQWLEESGINPEDLISLGKKIKNVVSFRKPFTSNSMNANTEMKTSLSIQSSVSSVTLKGSFLKRTTNLQKHIQIRNSKMNTDGARSTKSVCFRTISPDPEEKQDANLVNKESDCFIKPSSKRIKLMSNEKPACTASTSKRNSQSIFDLF